MNDKHRAVGRRRAVNVSVDPGLVAEARELGVPLSETFEEALRMRVIEARHDRWRRENADAIAEYHERVAQHGVFSDGLRRF